MDITIKQIAKKDKQGIHNMIEVINKTDKLDYSLTSDWLDYIIDEAGEGILVGYFQDKLIGLATCMIDQIDKKHARINIVVDPDYRNRGFGTCFYNSIIKYAKSKGVEILEAYVKSRLQETVGFAKRRDFKVVLYSWQMELSLNSFNCHNDTRNDLLFKLATVKDGQDYSLIIKDCFGDELDNNALEKLLKDPSISVFMLEKEGQAIASVTVQLRENLSLGYIYDVAVLGEYRGAGLGSYVLHQCLLQLKNRGIKKASLLVAGENKNAIALYKKLGFKEADTDMIMKKNI